jgi:hypothetical protein
LVAVIVILLVFRRLFGSGNGVGRDDAVRWTQSGGTDSVITDGDVTVVESNVDEMIEGFDE